MRNLRTVEILRASIWYNSDFEDIIEGDIFRLFEFDGTVVIGVEGKVEFKAINTSYLNEKNGVWEVNCKEVGHEELMLYDFFI